MDELKLTTGPTIAVPLAEIRPSPDNPRGKVKLGQSFTRLVDSIKNVGGILVPLVIQKLAHAENGIKYELIDGERRYRAAVSLRLLTVPAHIVEANVTEADLRRFMFHLHMTREQWEAIAQVKSLAEMYKELDPGIPFSEKTKWSKSIAESTYMDPQTAQDRVRVLAWPKALREQIFDFQENNPEVDIYSYVLATEASIVEPYARATKDQDGSSPSDKEIDTVRRALLDKLLRGIETGAIKRRDQIRQVKVLFSPALSKKEWVVSKRIFRHLASKGAFSFDDVLPDVQIELPGVAAERPAKPRRVIALMNSLSEILTGYRTEYIDSTSARPTLRKTLRTDFLKALSSLGRAVEGLRNKL
jgi:ParB/RepB/Spo0J family partition protein